jgi:uncharacterized phage infection (PIP) family protein YhgE
LVLLGNNELKAAWLSITSPKRKEGRKMSEDKTKETKDARSFEERVFERFDSSDERFDRVISAMDIRITKLEKRQYDTKPIWERALAEIAETNRKVDLLQLAIEGVRKETRDSISELRAEMNDNTGNLRTELKENITGLRTEMNENMSGLRTEMNESMSGLRNEMNSEFASFRQEMRSEFAAFRQEMKHAIHGVGYKIEALTTTFFQVQADQLDVECRLQELESKVERT